MTKRYYILSFQDSKGNWLEMPEADEPCIVSALVEALLRFRKLPGEFIKIGIREDYRAE